MQLVRHRAFHLLSTALIACAVLAGVPAKAQESWKPNRTVEFIVPSGAGAALDTAARELVNLLKTQQQVAEPIVVSNRSGAAGSIALQVLQQHPGDAHWLATFTTGMINARIIGGVSPTYAEMTPIAMLLEEAIVVAVQADSPLRDARDLVAELRTDPTKLSIGIATAVGNHIHAGVAKPLKVAGIDISKLTIVPFRSSAESMTSLLGGHIDVVAASTPNVIAQLQAGRIRVLAIATAERLPGALASVPTWTEQGIPAVFSSGQGVLGPKDMTAAQRKFWEDALRTATEKPEWETFLASQNWRPMFIGSDEMTRYLQAEYSSTKILIDDLKLTRN